MKRKESGRRKGIPKREARPLGHIPPRTAAKRAPRQPAAGPAGDFAFDLMFRAAVGTVAGWWCGMAVNDVGAISNLGAMLHGIVPAIGLSTYYVKIARHAKVRTVRFVIRISFLVAFFASSLMMQLTSI